MEKIKVHLVDKGHSLNRGVGFYAKELRLNLAKHPKILLTDKDPDITHYPFFDPFYPSLPIFTKNLVVTIHDLIPLTMPKDYPIGVRGKINLFRQKLILSSAKMVITDSMASRKDLIRYFHLPDNKITVTPLAIDSIYQKKTSPLTLKQVIQKYNLPKEFILYVGGINVNKNLATLFSAVSKVNKPLILVGSEFTKEPRKTFSLKSIFGMQKKHPELAQFLSLKPQIDGIKIKSLGFVPTDELAAIYKLCSVYCQPSFNEGFGLPLLEALTVGAVTVSSNGGSLPEIYPSGNLTFDPYSTEDLVTNLKKAMSLNPKQKTNLVSIGKKRASEFSWKKTVELTVEAYQKTLILK